MLIRRMWRPGESSHCSAKGSQLLLGWKEAVCPQSTQGSRLVSSELQKGRDLAAGCGWQQLCLKRRHSSNCRGSGLTFHADFSFLNHKRALFPE